ncbi:MAG TPA: DUF1501 domain-containing protein [Candidatus Kapabacteria bacterium]|nr:DUF1501 domain-containing protein [Candidatus Kapabacteria bacterium]
MERRKFIKNTAVVGAGMLAIPNLIYSQKDIEVIPNEKLLSDFDDNIVIFIELFGGNDGLNTIIPAEDDEYFKLRPSINIPPEEAVKVNDVYFNRGLVKDVYNNGFQRMFEDGRLAVIQGIGYDQPNMSHFRSEDIWQSGINPKTNNSLKLLEGWLGRYFALKLPDFPLNIPEHPISIAIDGTTPLMFKSEKGDMGIALTDPEKFYELGHGLTPKESLISGNSNYANEFNYIHTIAKQSELYSNAVYNAYQVGKDKINATIYSDNSLSQKMKLISSLIAGGLKTKVFFLRLSNFDSHAQQMDAAYGGGHYALLNSLASAVSEFMDDALKLGFSERITGMTISEFGRRTYDNGSRGTDHGAASMQFLFGNDKFVNGGYWNNRPNLKDLDINGNLKYQTDYRVIYTEVLEKRLSAKPEDIEKVFGESLLPLNVLENRVSSVESYLNKVKDDYLLISPNPNYGIGTITFEVFRASKIQLSIYNTNGKLKTKLIDRFMVEGVYTVNFNINESGLYFCSLSSGNKRYVQKILVNR